MNDLNTKSSVFKFVFVLIDDDKTLGQVLRATLQTRKLRRFCESALIDHYNMPMKSAFTIYHANNADNARTLLDEIEQRSNPIENHKIIGQCTIAFIDFDMPDENGLDLAESIKNYPIKTILFTGRQPHMQAYIQEKGKKISDFGIDLLMLKGAATEEFNGGVIQLLEEYLRDNSPS